MGIYSLSKDSEETIPRAEIKDTSYESKADFHWEKTKKKKKKKILITENQKRNAFLPLFWTYVGQP